jgi:hypothetical protein
LIPDAFTLASADCNTCLATYCCEQFNACENSSGCQAYIQHATGAATGAELAPLQSCASTNCPNLCPSTIQ